MESTKSVNISLNEKKTKRTELFYDFSVESSVGEEVTEILLTKEKLMELQAKDSNEIESFINLLPFYGDDTSLIKQRPNKEEYVAGKVREPKIRIDVNNFIKRVDLKIKMIPSLYNNSKKSQMNRENLALIENKEIKNNNSISSIIKNSEISKSKEKEKINKEIIEDYSIALINIFTKKNLKFLKIFDLVLFIIVIIFIVIDFYFMNIYLNNYKKKFLNLDNSYKILENIL